ncbi:unnamed protein product [Moneuplotes crassus]|uniref:Uncharacterized protein n=1 Tax=Euplotes crassus TaxID=5936 RepID=A0AAD1XX41_EUPCR|nr:unnamed protein product [Moneuplotes crassus]
MASSVQPSTSKKDYHYLFKLVLIGDSAVGKSCLLIRFADDDFTDNYVTTIGVDFRFRTLKIDDYSVKLQIWDTAGQERYRTITNAYYRGADGIIVVFDLASKESFQSLPEWLDEVKKSAPEDTVIIAFANKCDLYEEREVSELDVKNFTARTGIPVVETSAKSAENVEKGFLKLTSKLIEKRMEEGDSYEQDATDQFFNPAYERKQGFAEATSLRVNQIKEKIENIDCCNGN